ncbi:MAG TPA: (Fe-S)-binding protein [Ktedonobacterales bacterium]|nr:(Fe-S)-binding protein [Ktedonobacterales bacterium]
MSIETQPIETQRATTADELAASSAPSIRGFTGPDQPRDDILQRCIHCGLCLPSCPTYLETYRETSSPRGRISLIRAVASGSLDVTNPGFVDQMYECLDCRACEPACPSGVQYGQLVETARTQIERARSQTRTEKVGKSTVFEGLFGDMRRFRLASGFLRLYQRSGARDLARSMGITERLGLTDAEALLPELPASFVTPRGQVYSPPPGIPNRGRVALFAGCVMSTVFAETDRATIRVLTANGYEVALTAGQGCCGALTIHAGEMNRARVLARRNIAAFENSGARYVIANAAGCGAALKEYGQLLADDSAWAPRASAFALRVRDVTELLGALQARGELNTRFIPLPLRVTYQEPCHLAHAQRISRQPRALLQAIPGLELIEMDEPALCCGSAGIYNITRPDMASRLGDRKAHNVAATSARAVVTANPGCALQLSASLRRIGSRATVYHIVDILDAAYRGRSLT